jgi:hypothetical protein
MTDVLRKRAAEHQAGATSAPRTQAQTIDPNGKVLDVASVPVDYGTDYELPPITSLAETPVRILWAHLMRDVRNIQRQSVVPVQGKNVKFRGINEVIAGTANAVRRYGLIIVPVGADLTASDTASASKGTPMREIVGVWSYQILGPMGDTIPFVGAGQAADTGDRAVTKAGRVAYRNALLDLLNASTGAPDPEETEFERGVPRVSDAAYRAELLDPATPLDRMRQIRKEIGEQGRLDYLIADGYGADVSWRTLIDHVGAERKLGRDPYPTNTDEPPTEGGDE